MPGIPVGREGDHRRRSGNRGRHSWLPGTRVDGGWNRGRNAFRGGSDGLRRRNGGGTSGRRWCDRRRRRGGWGVGRRTRRHGRGGRGRRDLLSARHARRRSDPGRSGHDQRTGLDDHPPARPQGRPDHDRRGTVCRHGHGISARWRGHDDAPSGEPPRRHRERITRRHEARNCPQHHQPKACASSHGTAPFCQTGNPLRATRRPRSHSIRLSRRRRQHVLLMAAHRRRSGPRGPRQTSPRSRRNW